MIMDYEKKYKEALEKLRSLHDDYDTISTLIDIKEELEYIFPELKESEDEKIRKEIMEYEKNTPAAPEEHIEQRVLSRWIAWLEKQVSPDMVADAYLRGCNDTEKKLLEKQGKKSNANCLLSWSKIDEKMFQSLEGIVEDYWAKAEQEKNEIKIKEASNVSYFLKTIQKSPLCWIKCSDGLPNRDGTYLVVTDGRHNDVYDLARYDSIDGWHKASEIIYWMPIPQLNNKSIIEQKPTDKEMKILLRTEYEKGRADAFAQMQKEWSEEDYAMIEAAINIAHEYGRHGLWVWLKSLKERYTWKPSDEQMEELSVAKDSYFDLSYKTKNALKSLYKDLKKRKEE